MTGAGRRCRGRGVEWGRVGGGHRRRGPVLLLCPCSAATTRVESNSIGDSAAWAQGAASKKGGIVSVSVCERKKVERVCVQLDTELPVGSGLWLHGLGRADVYVYI